VSDRCVGVRAEGIEQPIGDEGESIRHSKSIADIEQMLREKKPFTSTTCLAASRDRVGREVTLSALLYPKHERCRIDVPVKLLKELCKLSPQALCVGD
jgi:hypothetical protein